MSSLPVVAVVPVALCLGVALAEPWSTVIEVAPRLPTMASTPQAPRNPAGVKVPNAETREALRDSYQRRGLTESNSLNLLISSSLT